ncbi:MAG: CBS domain-containing protein [Desulfobacterales bacterium]|nr:CBS domain-containing protein [Desulfobacterales bacterium]
MKIITTHKGSDFDALASLAAATIVYPDAKPVLPGSINANLKAFLSIHKDLFDFYSPKEIDIDGVETLIVVDTHTWKRLDQRLQPLAKKENLEIIVWDHHSKGDMDAGEKYVRETGATVTMLVQEIERQRKLITPIQATLFLMGLYEDTGNMAFPSTLAEDAYAAGFLLDRKADLNILSTFLKPAYGKKQKDILFEMIQLAERSEIKGGFTMSLSEMEVNGRVQNLAMVLQMYKDIVNVDVAFGIFRDSERDKCMVIGRSGVDEVNIGFMMRSMGGGGHPGAGSALLKGANPGTIREMIMELIQGNQYSSVMLSDIMSYPVVTVNATTPVEEVVMLLRDMGCTGMPVVDDDDKIVGVISRRDFKKVRKSKQMQSPVKAIMSRNLITIPHNKSAIEAARLMIKHDIGRIPVMKEDKIIGIITRSDAMLYFYDLLPD